MPKVKYVGLIRKSGTTAGETFATLANGNVISRAHPEVVAPQNLEQKTNVSGFSEITRHSKYLKRVFRVSFPPDSKGVKWSNRFTQVNKRNAEAYTTTKNDPDTDVDPTKKAVQEFTTVIHWNKVIMADGPLWKPDVTVTKLAMSREKIAEVKRKQLDPKADNEDGTPVEITVKEDEMYTLQFTQTPHVFEGAYAYANDKLQALIYDPETYFSLFIPLRERGASGSTSAYIPAEEPVEKLHVYVFAMTADKKTTSKSVYLTVSP